MYNKYKKFLADTKKDLTFKTSQGEIRSLAQLRNILLEKGESFYNEYVGEENHFANWIGNVFEDHQLARSLNKAKSYKKAIKIIDERVRYLRLWLNYNENLDYALDNFDIEFIPEYHIFENLAEFNRKNKVKLNPPKPPVFKKPESKDEVQLRKLMESHFPGFTPKKKESMLTNFFNKFRL